MHTMKWLTSLMLVFSLAACDCFTDSYRDSDRDAMRCHHSCMRSGSGSRMGTGGYAGPSAATRDQTAAPYPGGPADTGPKGPVRDGQMMP